MPPSRSLIYRGTVMPNGGLLDSLRYVFACPAPDCRYAWHAATHDAAETQAFAHFTSAGGDEHAALRMELLESGSPLFREHVA